MKRFRVQYSARAAADLESLARYLTRQAGAGIARAYVRRLRASCDSLRHMPHRGTERPELGPRWRTFGFERRATIVFVIEEEGGSVTILRVFYGGRSISA